MRTNIRKSVFLCSLAGCSKLSGHCGSGSCGATLKVDLGHLACRRVASSDRWIIGVVCPPLY